MNFEVEMIRQYVRDEFLCRGAGFTRKDYDKWRRYYLMTVLRYQHDLILEKIGDVFGLDHATVVNGLRQWEILKNYPDVQRATKEVQEEFPMGKLDTMRIKSNEVKSLLILERMIDKFTNAEICK